MKYDIETQKQTGIFIFDKLIQDSICDNIIDVFEKSKNTKQGEIGANIVDEKIKKSLDLALNIELDLELEKNIYKSLDGAFIEMANFYFHLKHFPLHFIGLQMQKSLKNEGFFAEHTDISINNKDHERFVAVIAYLNDVIDGGETQFYNPDLKIKPKKGRVIMFPATWQYLHKGCIPVSNDKYVVTTFIVCDRNN